MDFGLKQAHHATRCTTVVCGLAWTSFNF